MTPTIALFEDWEPIRIATTQCPINCDLNDVTIRSWATLVVTLCHHSPSRCSGDRATSIDHQMYQHIFNNLVDPLF